jgi:Uma2 family endonuclease
MLTRAKRIRDSSPLDEIDIVHMIHAGLELPDGFRLEVVDGQVTVAAAPFGRHAVIVKKIMRAAQDALPPGYELYEATTAREPGGDRYVPDLAAWPENLIDTDAEWVFPAAESLFVAEVTSPGHRRRGYTKAAGYARASLPTYLLVDRRKRECLVYTDPKAGHYQNVRRVRFGQPVNLVLAGPVTIDTSEF